MNWGTKGIGKTRWGDLDEEEEQDFLRRHVKKEKPKLVELNFTTSTKCKGCCFKKHSNPSNVTEEEKAYCCVWCLKSGGKRHGGRCEQLR